MEIVKTKTNDGIVLNGLLSEPSTESKSIVIHIHGMGGSILLEDFYINMHQDYPKNGYAFLAGENRGLGVVTPFIKDTGKLVTLGSAFEEFESSLDDIGSWVNFATNRGYTDIYLQGHSLGCTKAAYYLDKKANSFIKGMIFISPAPILGLSEMKNTKEVISKAKELLAKGKGEELLRDNDWGAVLLSAKTIMNLFGERSNLGIFNFSDDAPSPNIIRKIKLPVLAFTGTEDRGVMLINDPYRAMEILKKELINSPYVKTVVYAGAKHLFQGFGDQITKEVVDFIKKEPR